MNWFLAVLVVFWAAMTVMTAAAVGKTLGDQGRPSLLVPALSGILWPVVILVGLANGLRS